MWIIINVNPNRMHIILFKCLGLLYLFSLGGGLGGVVTLRLLQFVWKYIFLLSTVLMGVVDISFTFRFCSLVGSVRVGIMKCQCFIAVVGGLS